MSKRSKGNHGIYELTCISDKCSRRFKVIYDIRRVSALQRAKWAAEANIYDPKPAVDYVKFTYPFTGCPFCGAWWPTGPLDGEAYPKREKSVRISGPALTNTERQLLIDALLRDQAKARSGASQLNWQDTKWTW